MDQRALAIVGMRRSGTSSISLVLHGLGVSFGDESQLFRGNEFNEEGYWEHRALCAVHRKFRMSLSLRAVDCDPTPDDWLELPASASFVERGVRCLRDFFFNIRGPWAWKDPDASLALPFVYEVSRIAGFMPYLLVCIRNPFDVARSEERRKGIPELETVGAWLAHTLEALRGSKGRPRSVALFSDFLSDPRRSLEPAVAALGMAPSDKEWESAIASIRRELVHSRADDDVLDKYPPLVKRVYELCARAAKGFDDGLEEEIEACYREFESYRGMLWRPVLEEATLGALWERGSGSEVTRLNYRPSRSWQTVVVETGALPGNPVQLFLYPLPANVWIRKATWHHQGQATEAKLEAGRSGNLWARFGLTCVSVIHGPDHLVVKTPAAKGPFSLELEFLIESNNLVTGEIYKFLSDQCRQ